VRFSIQIQTTCRTFGAFVQPHGPAARLVVGDGVAIGVCVAVGVVVTTVDDDVLSMVGDGTASGGALRPLEHAEVAAANSATATSRRDTITSR
jgi:hypothetical protein